MSEKKSKPKDDPDFLIYYAKVAEIGSCDGKECEPEAHDGEWVFGISLGDNCLNLCPAREKELLEKLLNAFVTRARPGLKFAKGLGAKGELSKETVPELLEKCLQDYEIQ